MVRAIVLLAIVAIILIAAAVWSIVAYRQKVAKRDRVRLDYLRGILRRADVLLDSYSPNDSIGQELERQVREVFISYHTAFSVSDRPKRWLEAAEVAHGKLSRLIAQYPQSLFAPTDDVDKAFVREMFSILHPTQPKEIPHVP